MADKKISALTGATTPLAGTEVLPIVQGSVTVKVSVANLTAGRAVAMAGGSFTDNITQGTAAKGVNFTTNTPAAGMTSQLLNWYEEGTWTPVDSSGAGLTLTFTAAEMRYTRIGRNVFVQGQITFPSTASTDTVLIGGLPFTSSANNRAGLSLGNNTFAANYVPFVSAGSGFLQFYIAASGGAQPTNANLSTALFVFSGTYTV